MRAARGMMLLFDPFHTKYFVAQSFDPTRSQQIGVSEYVALASFLRSASNTFTAYDNQRSARITLDFNQWVYACAQVL